MTDQPTTLEELAERLAELEAFAQERADRSYQSLVTHVQAFAQNAVAEAVAQLEERHAADMRTMRQQIEDLHTLITDVDQKHGG